MPLIFPKSPSNEPLKLCLNDEDLVSGDPADISIFLPYPRDVPRGDRVVMAPNSNSVFYPISKSWNLSSFGIVYFMYEVEFLPLPNTLFGEVLLKSIDDII